MSLRGSVVVGLVMVGVAAGSGAALAEAISLPRPSAPLQPIYPAGATGAAVVKLEVTVDAEGVAQSVRVVEGAPPFSAAALAAAAATRFEPARKEGRAVAAKFLLAVRFTQPPPPPPEPVAAAAKAPPESANVSQPANPETEDASASRGMAKPVGDAASASLATAKPVGGAGTTGPATAKPGGDAASASLATAKPGGDAASASHGMAKPVGGAGTTGPATAEAAVAPSAPVVPIDVSVDGARAAAASREPAGTHFSAKSLSRIPGAFGDAFRALEILPGVVPFMSGLPYFYVRGATPTTTGYFLDGVPVPLLFHVGAGPSVLPPSIVAGFDFYPGGYPAAFGRQIGGILAAETVMPAPKFSADATLRLLDAGAFVTAPLGDRGSAFVAGRTSFTQAILPLITKDANLGYWDYQAGANYRFGSSGRLRLLAFGADDFLTQQKDGKERTIYRGQFHRVDLAYQIGPEARGEQPLAGAIFGGDEAEAAPFDGRIAARVAATFGMDRSTIDGQGELHTRLGQARSQVEVPLHRAVRLRAGTNVLVEEHRIERVPDAARPSTDDGSFSKVFPPRTVGTYGAFADIRLSPAPFIELVAGVRGDFFGDRNGGVPAFDPRASLRIALLPWLKSVSTFGIAHQRPSFLLPVPGLAPAADELVLQEAVQVSQGLEFALPFNIGLRATGYFHDYQQLNDFLATCGPGQIYCLFTDRAAGRSYGLEVMLQRALSERLGGQIAYTLSRTERTVGGETFTADTDRTHVVNVVLGYEVAPGWHAGARFTGYSGRPFSLIAHDDPMDGGVETLVGKRNVPRSPGFFRLDVRLSKTWRIGARGYLTAVLEGLNVTLAKETIDIDCRTPIDAGQACGPQEFGPIAIPSIGLNGGF